MKFPIGDCGEDNNRNLSFVEYSIRYITGVVTCILGALNINKSQLSIVLPFNRHLKFCHLASVDIHIYMITSFCLTINWSIIRPRETEGIQVTVAKEELIIPYCFSL